jgi:hypothetical protein|tara:strand:+ start:599 stop:841 length:243 start_codon:yes stop_codon:yes gene_type:complete
MERGKIKMSDLAYEAYSEQMREKCLEEIYPKIAEHYDGDTLDSIIDNVYNKVVSPLENYSKFVTREDIKELVIEYSDSLR